MWVFIYTILFVLCSILYGRFLEYIATKYEHIFVNEDKKKSKVQLILEVSIQLGLTSVGVYIFRELINFSEILFQYRKESR